MTGAAWLAGTSPVRVVELPRRPAPPDGGPVTDLGRRQRLAAVVAAYHALAPTPGGRLLLGWSRSAAGRPVHVFAGGGMTGPVGADGRLPLSLPPGAVGVPYPDGQLAGMLHTMPCWTRIGGVVDGLLVVDVTDDRAEHDRPSLDDCLLRVWADGFAWLLLAEPVPVAEVVAGARAAAAEEREAQSRASSPEQAVRATRMGHRHRELRQGESTGMWRVHLLAGAATPAAAAAVAGLLCASADLGGLPYALVPSGVTGALTEVVEAAVEPSPFVASSLLVAALAVAPVEEIPGVRLAMRSEFDVTPETSTDGPAVTLGQVLDHSAAPVEGLRIGTDSLNRHTFVCGATGAGKSQTVRHLLEEASGAGLPWLVVEPAKTEYRRMAGRLGGDRVVVIRPGEVDAPPAGFNPLRPAPGFPLQTHLDLVRALFLAAFEADEPFPQVLSTALTRCYLELGWDLALGEPQVPGHRPRYPTLGDLQHAAERVVDEIGYGREVTDNVRGFIRVRLSSLRLGTTGRFFEGGHPLHLAELVRRNVVFEIEDVGDDRDKAFLMGALLIQLVEHLRTEARREPAVLRRGLRHVSVFEEAHRLLRRADRPGPAAHAVELFAALLAEIRAYGEGLVIAEQIPSKLIPDVIKNTAVKVLHRLPALDDREAVGATVNLTERQSQYLVTLPPGTGAVFADGMDQPVLVRMPDGTAREHDGATATAPVADLVGRRSASCGRACQVAPCTLRDMRAAHHLLNGRPWLVVWAELAVLGHLTGWSTPAVTGERIDQLLTLPARTRECALSHAVDEAVAVRSALLSAETDPAELAAHVVGALQGRLTGEARCASEEPRFLARPYRWVVVWDELRAAADADPAADRHPRSDEWEKWAGRLIPGGTCAEQATAVGAWLDDDLRDPGVRETVAFGARAPSALERAVGTGWTAPDWAARLDRSVRASFVRCEWPGRTLVPPSGRVGA